MKKVIEGKMYNTETADLICNVNNSNYGDFSHYDCEIYKTKNGSYFAFGSGGPMSMFSVSSGQNSWSGSSDRIIVLDKEEALSLAESEHSDADSETIEKFFDIVEA